MSIDADALRMDERPLPMPDPVSQPYWDALAEGRLMLQRCTDCRTAQFYPRALCARCAGDVEWFEASGRGQVHTFSITRFAFAEPFKSLAPYVLAVVELDEGPRMMTNVIGSPVEQVEIGSRVRLLPVATADVTVPFWTLEDR